MASLELTIINAIMQHPILYKDINFDYSKEKVLDHLFFVNGNGYEWVNGELVDDYANIIYEVIPENYFNTPSMGALQIYPICEYAKILHLPNDIAPDWLFGAIEALLLAENYFDNPYQHCLDTYISDWMEDRNYKAIQKYLKEQKKFLRAAKKRIKQLSIMMMKKGIIPGT